MHLLWQHIRGQQRCHVALTTPVTFSALLFWTFQQLRGNVEVDGAIVSYKFVIARPRAGGGVTLRIATEFLFLSSSRQRPSAPTLLSAKVKWSIRNNGLDILNRPNWTISIEGSPDAHQQWGNCREYHTWPYYDFRNVFYLPCPLCHVLSFELLLSLIFILLLDLIIPNIDSLTLPHRICFDQANKGSLDLNWATRGGDGLQDYQLSVFWVWFFDNQSWLFTCSPSYLLQKNF